MIQREAALAGEDFRNRRDRYFNCRSERALRNTTVLDKKCQHFPRLKVRDQMMLLFIEPGEVGECIQILALSGIKFPTQQGMNHGRRAIEIRFGAYGAQRKTTDQFHVGIRGSDCPRHWNLILLPALTAIFGMREDTMNE